MSLRRPAAAADPLAAARPARVVTTEVCQTNVRRALAELGLVFLVGRASASSGARAIELAVSSAINAAIELERREGVLVRHLLPAPDELKIHHRAHLVVDPPAEALDGTMIDHRWSLYGGEQLGVLVLITTGTGTKVSSIDFDQPALHRVARLAHHYRPAVVYARSLTRIGRGYLGPLIDVLQALGRQREDGPFLGDDETRLAELDFGTEVNVSLKGVAFKHEAQRIVSGNLMGMRSHTGMPHETLPGVWWFGNPRPAPPGLTKLKLRTYDNSQPRTALVLDCPAARPPEALIAAGLPPPRSPDGQVADQVLLIRWLGAHLYTPGWDARACAAHLAAHSWAPPAMRLHRTVEMVTTVVNGQPVETLIEEPALRLSHGPPGRNDGQHALRAFLGNLDFYETGELAVHLPDGGQPIHLTGVLPLDGQPWITPAQAARIRDADAHRHTGPRNKHLFAGLPVTLDGQAAVLYPRYRSNGVLVYFFRRASDYRRPVNSPRARPVPPLPATVLVQWWAEAAAALALPVSLHLAAQPAVADPADTKQQILEAEVADREQRLRHQEAHLKEAMETATPSHSLQFMRRCVDEASNALSGKRDELSAARRQQRVAPVLPGAPLSKLVGLGAALTRPRAEEEHRLLVRNVTLRLYVTTAVRRSLGRRPAQDLSGELVLGVHDGTDAWRSVSQHRWTGGAVHRVPGRLAEAIDGLYDGIRLKKTLGADWARWLPAIRAALGCPGSVPFAWADDARLIRLGMAVIHPRRPVVAVPGDPEDVVRYADPPVDPAALPGLADALVEPVALLRAIHDRFGVIFTHPDRQLRWTHNPSKGVAAAYAAAADSHGVLPRCRLPAVLRAGRDQPDRHRLADEWTLAGEDQTQAVLRACGSCGGTGRAVMRLREVTGSVCLTCGNDRAGVHWDASYDRFRDAPCPPC